METPPRMFLGSPRKTRVKKETTPKEPAPQSPYKLNAFSNDTVFHGQPANMGINLQPYVPETKVRFRDMTEDQRNDYYKNIDQWGNGWSEAVKARKENPRQLVYNSRYVDPMVIKKMTETGKWYAPPPRDYDYDGVPDIAIFDAKTGRIKAFNGLAFQRARDTYDTEYKQWADTEEKRAAYKPSRYYFEEKFGGQYDDLGEIANKDVVMPKYVEYKEKNKGRKLPRVTDKTVYQFFTEQLVKPITDEIYRMLREENQKIKLWNAQNPDQPPMKTTNPVGVIAKVQATYYRQYFTALFLNDSEYSIMVDESIPETKGECKRQANGDPMKEKDLTDKYKQKYAIKKRFTLEYNRKLIKSVIAAISGYNSPEFSKAFLGGIIYFFANSLYGDNARVYFDNIVNSLKETYGFKDEVNFNYEDAESFVNNPKPTLEFFKDLCNKNLKVPK